MPDMTLRLALEIEDIRWTQALPHIESMLKVALSAALADIESDGRPLEVGVRLVDDGTIQALNRDWRGRDKPTNVLSFPIGDPVPVADADFPWLLGDIVFAFDTVQTEAVRDRKSLAHHVTHLAVHAALHLIGHDHETDAEAEQMEATEIAILAAMNIPNPYTVPEPEISP